MERLYDAVEIAAVLGVTPRWVRDTTRAGRMPHVKLGRWKRYDLDDVLRWVEANKGGGSPMTFRTRQPVPPTGTE
jgi:excisionase family DNA binding protein